MGTCLLAARLAVRDVRRHAAQPLFLLFVIAGAATVLALRLVLGGAANHPHEWTRAAARGPNVVAYLPVINKPGDQRHGAEDSDLLAWKGIGSADGLLVRDEQSVRAPGSVLLSLLALALVAALSGDGWPTKGTDPSSAEQWAARRPWSPRPSWSKTLPLRWLVASLEVVEYGAEPAVVGGLGLEAELILRTGSPPRSVASARLNRGFPPVPAGSFMRVASQGRSRRAGAARRRSSP